MSPVLTPAAARSVGGYGSRRLRTITAAAGMRARASFACQPSPAADIATPRRPPMTSPPGHQAWSRLSLVVLSLGYRAAMRGLMTVSTRPQPMPCRSAPASSVV